ncbi:MAG: hypothetical protein EOP00_17675 [Pedobacter sp.]|nr:MAG: hypothetical protein EOP00_17675 [Pedobacter sp.]
MDNLKFNLLKDGDLANTLPLADILGDEWDEGMIRYGYQIAINKLLKTHDFEVISGHISIDGKTTLSLINKKHYLFENIDIWCHEVYASEALMLSIIKEMNGLCETN